MVKKTEAEPYVEKFFQWLMYVVVGGSVTVFALFILALIWSLVFRR